MSLFLEVWSDDVTFNGDGTSTEGKVNLVGWPFNLDLSEAGQYKIAAMLVEPGEQETLTQVECVQDGTFVTIKFPEPIAGGEFKIVRLRAKVLV